MYWLGLIGPGPVLPRRDSLPGGFRYRSGGAALFASDVKEQVERRAVVPGVPVTHQRIERGPAMSTGDVRRKKEGLSFSH